MKSVCTPVTFRAWPRVEAASSPAGTLLSLGYLQSKNDYSLFTKKKCDHLTTVAISVDDLLVTGLDQGEISFLKQ